MTSWQISESGATVTLDEQRRGEVTFTVTNVGTTADRAVLTITALEGTPEAWVRLEGATEPKAVGPGESVTYLARVNPPADAAAGTYAFQALAYSANRDPGESSVKSKRVTFELKPVVLPKGTNKWLLLLIPLAVIVVGVVLWLVLGGDDGLSNEALPEVSGTPEVLQELTADQGRWSEADEDLRFSFAWERCAEDDDEDCDAIDGSTFPSYIPGNDDVGRRLRIEVTAKFGDEEATARSAPTDVVQAASPQQFPVDEVIGLTRSEATAVLSAHFVVAVTTAGPAVTECDPIVQDQAPAAGTLLTQGELVTITSQPSSPLLLCIADLSSAFTPFLTDDSIEFDLDSFEELEGE